MSTVIVGYARTPFTKFTGALASQAATQLGGHAIAAALAKAGIEPTEVQQVYVGQVLQGGAGQNPARQSAVAAGIPLTTPAMTLNAVCLSGMEAVVAGVRLIDSGEADIVVAAGQESMTLAPHVWSGSRAGKKYGAIELVDSLDFDGLTDAFQKRSMGSSTEEHNGSLLITRDQQDAWAARSHTLLADSLEFQSQEIAPVVIPGRRGDVTVDADDGVRPGTTVESLGALRPAFGEGGTITAGNSSQITDGAAAIVLMSEAAAAARGITGIARVRAHALVAGPDLSLHAQPANAILSALGTTPFATKDLVAVEINEAFAAVSVQSVRVLDISEDIVNTHGGAIAMGHPIGASGTRIVGTLARQLEALGSGSVGAAGICGGGGQGSAVILEAV